MCGGHKMCVGDRKSVWETQNLCGRHKHTLHVTRYTCLRVCWIPRAAPELWFLKDVLDEMTIPRKKTHYALDETYVFEPKLFLKGSALVGGGWWVVGGAVRCQIQIPRFAREKKTYP